MPWNVLIRGGEVVTPSGVSRLDIAIEDGTIVELATELTGQARETIDASGLHVFPGVIDPHVHFNEPGRTDWEGFETGSAALAAGGGTCFFDMPLNSSPPVLDGAAFDAKRAAAERNSVSDFALWGGLTPDNLDKLEELAERGVIGFKAFMCDSGIEDFARADMDTLRSGMQIAARLGLPVAVHAEDEEMTRTATASIRAQGGRRWDDYLRSRTMLAERVAIPAACELARQTKCDLHVVHVSISPGPFIVDQYRYDKVSVTCETCPHYLLMTEEDLRRLGAPAKCAPPLRTVQMRDLLLNRLRDGRIHFVASDHSPAPPSMKTGDDAFAVWGGISGVQSTLASLLTLEPPLEIERVSRLTSSNIADRFRLGKKGQIAGGNDADLALVDVQATFTLTRDMLLDRHKLSPYVGREFRGLVRRTIVRGHTVFQDGRITAESFRGRLIKPSPRAATEGNGLDA